MAKTAFRSTTLRCACGSTTALVLVIVVQLGVTFALAAQPDPVAPAETVQKTGPQASTQPAVPASEPLPDTNRLGRIFSLQNVLGWLATHGIRILIILSVLAVTLWGAKRLQGRLITVMALRGGRGSPEERQARLKTLVGVMQNALGTVAMVAAVIMVLEELSVPVGPILGGAAVVGLAIAFGAQSLIKDYFTGFMVLVEQQYVIGDVVQICNVKGQVERITLRMTVLRDLEGKAHFIPHGQIHTVTNMTHEWSRAVFDIGVAYKEDVDRVIEVLRELGQALRADPQFESSILDGPVMLGVDAFGDSAVIIKFTMMTRPMRQWEVKREMLRRIKNRFDELEIEIPFPHRTLYFANASPDKVR